ncbi:MAG: hypothetical protein PWP24_1225 [Clostridiales bacterium]|nr:hypothetical protein [Clostridiales bacterium]
MNILLIIEKVCESVLGVFQKLLRRELGEQRYKKYCETYDSYKKYHTVKARMESSQRIYEDLYEYLKDQELESLRTRMENLIEGMIEAVNINKHYVFAFVFYLGSALFLILQNINPWITIISLLLMSALFLYKTCEFVVNKYCYIDANIVLVYKSVLDRLLNSQEENEN